jgi:hypothetical protein
VECFGFQDVWCARTSWKEEGREPRVVVTWRPRRGVSLCLGWDASRVMRGSRACDSHRSGRWCGWFGDDSGVSDRRVR